MATEPTVPSVVVHGGMEITSNSDTKEQMEQSLGIDPNEAVSKAASELGKKGGKAAAEARAEKKAQATLEPETDPAEVAEPAKEDKPTEKEPEEEPAKEVLGKPRHDPKARMLEATRKEAEAKRERDAAKAEAEAARRERDELKAKYEAPKPEKAPEATGKPVRASFQSDEDYVEAVADWKAEEKVTKFKAEREQEEKVKAYASTIDEQLGKAVAARKEYAKIDPDFLDKVSDEVKAIANSPSFARDLHEKLEAKHIVSDEIILAEKHGPLLMLHLSDHEDDLQRILALRTPQEIQVEMRLLARSLNGAATTVTAPKSEVSKAKPPVKTVAGSPHIAEEDEGGDMDFDSFAAKRLKGKKPR